jgi:dolichol-phosphate mannosyltransferase
LALELSVVVPTYNESENLPILVERTRKTLGRTKHEIIVVDDNSPDGTGEIAENLAKKYGNIKVIHRKNKKGLASAVVDGFKHVSAPVICVIDADLQHPPEKIPELFDEINSGADIAVASRYVKGGGIKGWAKSRKIISRGAEILARLAIPGSHGLSDPLSGFFMLKKDVITGAELKPVGFKILLEVLVKGSYKKVVEVPYIFEKRLQGKSTLGFKEHLNYLRHISRLARASGEVGQFLKFCVVGLTGVFVNMGLLWALTKFIGLYYLISAIFAIEISILSNFTLNELWTFGKRQKKGGLAKRVASFNLACAIGAIFNYIILVALTEIFHLHYLLSNLFGIACATLWNYFMSATWVWKHTAAKDTKLVSHLERD